MTDPSPERRPTLYIVGTPIGNLADITLRAIETLERVSHVVAEDTRRTRALLSHLGIRGKRLSSLNANTPERVEKVLAKIEAGEDVAFVTDAGMPAISDPGGELVAGACARSLPVVCVPGPSAVTTALALAGFQPGPFAFLGFLPRRGRKRRDLLERIRRSAEAIVIFESATRVHDTLEELSALLPERRAVLCRELTKLHEEVMRGTLRDLTARTQTLRGEVTLVLEAANEQIGDPLDEAALDSEIERELRAGQSVRGTVEELSKTVDLPRRELYGRVQSAKERLDGD